jgi:hypothetical protein
MTEMSNRRMSRRAVLTLLAASFGAATVPAVLVISDADAQTTGMERRQERRTGRHERREARRTGRHERRETRRGGGAEPTTTGASTTTGQSGASTTTTGQSK